MNKKGFNHLWYFFLSDKPLNHREDMVEVKSLDLGNKSIKDRGREEDHL